MDPYAALIQPFIEFAFMRRALVACLALALGSALGEAVGILDATLAATGDYLKTRRQFGQGLAVEARARHQLFLVFKEALANIVKHSGASEVRIAIRAEDRALQMTVADTGLGFGKAATAGTGVGLANIRERLQLLYGNRALRSTMFKEELEDLKNRHLTRLAVHAVFSREAMDAPLSISQSQNTAAHIFHVRVSDVCMHRAG